MKSFKNPSRGVAARMPDAFPVAAAALAAFAFVQGASAQETRWGTTVVTATRVPQALESTTADMTVITQEQIERSGVTGVADVLARVPGVQISRNGGPGQSTSVYLRGTANQHALVMVDGIRFRTQELQGGAQWEVLPVAQIERIEILRGPAAAIYGSDAMGGVVQIFTRKGQGAAPRPYVEAGIGTHGTRKAAGGISGGASGWTYGVHLADERSDGFDVKGPYVVNPDKDGYANSSANVSLGYRQGNHSLDASLRHNQLKSHYESSAAPFDDFDKIKNTSASLKWTAEWTDSYRSVLQLSRNDIDVARFSASAESLDAQSDVILWQNIWSMQAHRFNLDFERIEDRLRTRYPVSEFGASNIDGKRVQNAVSLGWGVTAGAHSFNAHLRHDDVVDQQSKTTGSVGYGWQVGERLRWVASAGTAFRTPSLYERLGGMSAATLRPESSKNIESGLYFEEGAHKLSAVVYRNKIRDQIAYDFNSAAPCYCYDNIDRVRLTGLTLSGSTQLSGWNLASSLDFLNPKNELSGNQVPYRAKRMLKIQADTRVAGWTVGGDAQLYSQRQVNPQNSQQLPGYGLLGLYAERSFARDWSVLARVDNLADKDYEHIKGYATAGRSFFVSLKWAPR